MILSRASTLSFAVVTSIAVASALLAAWGLTVAARPNHFETRAASTQRNIAEASSLLRRKPSLTPVLIASCAPEPSTTAERLRAALVSLAATAQLGSTDVQVKLTERAAPEDRLVPMQLRFEATGPYDGALTALSRLANLRPAVFIDTLDLRSQTATVTLVVTGRAFCSALH